MTKALLLDRDGVINEDHGYVFRIEDFVFKEGIFSLCKAASDKGYAIFIITNQSGIARGYYTEDQLNTLHNWLIARFEEQGSCIKKIYHCPHHPTEGTQPYQQDCECRKPKPGMILQAQQEFNLDLRSSIFIGDKPSDMQAANKAGVGTKVLIGKQAERGLEDIQIEELKHLPDSLFS